MANQCIFMHKKLNSFTRRFSYSCVCQHKIILVMERFKFMPIPEKPPDFPSAASIQTLNLLNINDIWSQLFLMPSKLIIIRTFSIFFTKNLYPFFSFLFCTYQSCALPSLQTSVFGFLYRACSLIFQSIIRPTHLACVFHSPNYAESPGFLLDTGAFL